MADPIETEDHKQKAQLAKGIRDTSRKEKEEVNVKQLGMRK
jgi:hypothetical protein